MIKADLAGRIFVEDIELGLRPSGPMAFDRPDSFVQLPFEEALDFWRSYGGTDDVLEGVLFAYREEAEGNAGLFYDAVARRAIAELEGHIEGGGNTASFIEAMQSEAISLGIEPASPSYLENVYRTNVATAYSAGRAALMEDPDVLEEFPFAEFFATGDDRTRASHQALDGLVVRVGSPLYERLRTPLSYQCRCAWASISAEEVGRRGLTITETLPESMIPDGF